MEDLKKIQEFFSKPLEEVSNDYSPLSYAKLVANGKIDIEDAMKETGYSYVLLMSLVKKIKGMAQDTLREEEIDVTNDAPDIIAVDVPLFIRLLEFAREDAGDDMDLHEVAERAIEAVKMRGVLSMDDYETLVPPKEELDEVRLVPKDQIEAIATKLAAQIFSKKQDIRPAIDIFKKAVEDSYRALDPNVEIKEEEGYSKYLKDDPEFPGGKTPGLTPAVLDKILMKIVQDIDETKQLGEGVIEEELCPKGKAYIKKRMAAGEKSSAYLSGRAVKVCKGQMKG
jgi:hypothetical protein